MLDPLSWIVIGTIAVAINDYYNPEREMWYD